MKVVKIWDADMYRDGGSYGFCFYTDDGQWYEFFLRTAAFDEGLVTSHQAPVIYLEGCNSGRLVQHLSWGEAQDFMQHLSYDNERFTELVQIVANEGRKPIS